MSTAILTGIVGVLGVLVGVVAERLVQRLGKLRCETGEIRLEIEDDWSGNDPIHSLPLDAQRLEGRSGPVSVGYDVSIELFNEKELRTGLRDVAIVFRGRSGTRIETQPYDRSTVRVVSGIRRSDPVEVINLPSREWIHLDLSGSVGDAVASELTKCETVEFRGYFPDHRMFVKEIPIKSE